MAVGEEAAAVGETAAAGEMAPPVGGEAMAVGEALAATKSRGPAEVAGEVVEADAVEVAVALAMATEAGGQPSTAMKNPSH